MANDYNYTSDQVEELANKLSADFGNPKYFRWYCSVIYEFGIPYVEQLQARVSDAKYPGKLFSKIVHDRRKTQSEANNLRKLNEQKRHIA